MATVQTAPQYFPVHYKSARINDLDIFYREAGAPDFTGNPAPARISNLL